MTMNEKAVDLWRQYEAETDPTCREMLRQAYYRALDNDDEVDAVARRAIQTAEQDAAA